jgi:hypothetical protein
MAPPSRKYSRRQRAEHIEGAHKHPLRDPRPRRRDQPTPFSDQHPRSPCWVGRITRVEPCSPRDSSSSSWPSPLGWSEDLSAIWIRVGSGGGPRSSRHPWPLADASSPSRRPHPLRLSRVSGSRTRTPDHAAWHTPRGNRSHYRALQLIGSFSIRFATWRS